MSKPYLSIYYGEQTAEFRVNNKATIDTNKVVITCQCHNHSAASLSYLLEVTNTLYEEPKLLSSYFVHTI